MKLPVFKCKRPGCRHEWIPRTIKPTVCPKCKKPDWNDPKSLRPRKAVSQELQPTA